MLNIKGSSHSNHPVGLSTPITIALHLILVGAGSLGVYYLAQTHEQQQQKQQITQFNQHAAVVLQRHNLNWQAQAKLLAQQPMLNSTATLKAVIPVDGTVPPSLNYADQDLLNRSKVGTTTPEISGSGDQASVSTALPMPSGGYAVFEWSAKPLFDDLKTITPDYLDIKLSQTFQNAAPLEVLRVHSTGNDGLFAPNPINKYGWQLAVAYIPSHNSTHPLWLALMSFVAGLLVLGLWLARKTPQQMAQPTPLDNAENELETIQHKVAQASPQPALDLDARSSFDTKPPVFNELDNQSPDTSTAQQGAHSEQQTSNTTTDSSFLQDLDLLETGTLNTTSQQDTNLLEFTLGDVLLPDNDLNITQDKFPHTLFRAYDIRGSIDILSSALISDIARALAATLIDQDQYQVVVGYDARSSGPHYAKLVNQALVDSGLTVIDIGLVPSPVMHFAAKQHDHNGIIITASHNPADENGFKWIIAGNSPSPEDIQALKQRVIEQQFVEGLGSVISQDYKADYLNWLQEDVMLSQPFHVSIDGMNGSMGQLALAALQAAGCEVSNINTEPDGNFPQGAPDPSKASNLTELSNDISISGSHIGFAFDGDGDRLAVLDGQGNVISPDHLIALFATIALDSHPGADIVFDIKCSRLVANTISNAGGRPMMLRTGNTFLRTALHDPDNQVVFAGEFSSHFFFNDGRGQGQDDALYAALRLLEWLDQQGQSIDEIIAELPPRFATEDLYLPLDDINADEFITALANDAEHITQTKLSRIDGIRLDFERGFGIIRPSNTGAYLTARFDADSADDLQLIRSTFSQLIAAHDERLAQLILT